MCLIPSTSMPKLPAPAAALVTDPNAAANAAAQAEMARRRAALGFQSTIGASATGAAGPSLARKTLYGE